ncbi:hypothetical protein D3C72_1728280 [compost metagenome]
MTDGAGFALPGIECQDAIGLGGRYRQAHRIALLERHLANQTGKVLRIGLQQKSLLARDLRVPNQLFIAIAIVGAAVDIGNVTPLQGGQGQLIEIPGITGQEAGVLHIQPKAKSAHAIQCFPAFLIRQCLGNAGDSTHCFKQKGTSTQPEAPPQRLGELLIEHPGHQWRSKSSTGCEA